MNFKFECPNCKQRIAASRDDAGTIGTCPSCATQFTVPTPPPEARIVADTSPAAAPADVPPTTSKTARNIRAGLILAVLVLALGFIHIVRIDTSYTIIPKASFSFSNTFTSVSEIVDRYNSRTLDSALRDDPQLAHLVRELERGGHISSRKRTWSEIEDEVRRSLPDR